MNQRRPVETIIMSDKYSSYCMYIHTNPHSAALKFTCMKKIL